MVLQKRCKPAEREEGGEVKKYKFEIWTTDIYEIIVEAKSKKDAEKILNDNLNNEKYDFRYLPVETEGKTVYKGVIKKKEK